MSKQETRPEAVNLRRRGALKAMGAGAALAATAPLAGEAQAASSDVRKIPARFQPDAQEVRTFYRVNKY
jgi:hypothetical protein